MRCFGFIFLVASALIAYPQDTSPASDIRWSMALDWQSSIGSLGGFAHIGQWSACYGPLEAGVGIGYKNRVMDDQKPYEQAASKGYWIEPNLTALLPVLTSEKASQKSDLDFFLLVRGAVGFCNSDHTFTTTFESTGPYASYIHKATYQDVNTRYASLSVGTRFLYKDHFRFGYGVTAWMLQDKVNLQGNAVNQPFVMTPLNGKSKLAVYFALGVML